MRNDDRLTILRAQKGDALAFARLHDRYYHNIYRYYFYRVDKPNTAAQLTSDLFIRMVSRIRFYKSDSQKFAVWLYTLARSVLMEDRLRRGEGIRQRAEQPRGKANPLLLRSTPKSGAGVTPLTADSLHEALQTLSADERDVLFGRLIENRPLRQIAREIGRTAAAARRLQLIALQKLQWIIGTALIMRPDRELAFQLDDAIESLAHGKDSLPPLFGRTKDEQHLTTLIKTAHRVRETRNPNPPLGATSASKARMMQTLIEQALIGRRKKAEVLEDLGTGLRKESRGKGIILAVITLLFVFIFLSTLSAAALESLPGSWLYPAKLTVQQTHILLTFNPEVQQQRIENYYQARMQDLRAAVELKRLTIVEAQATITAIPTPGSTSTDVSTPSH